MKYSDYLKESMNEPWYEAYLQFDFLWDLIEEIKENPVEELEKKFIEMIRSEYKKCNAFYQQKIQEMKQDLETTQDLNYLMHQITNLYQYRNLNQIGFYKILKHHDRNSSIQCLTYYSMKLSNDLFCPVDQIYLLFVLFSKKHREVREKILVSSSSTNRYSYLQTQPPTEVYQQLVEGTLSQGLQADNFVRKSEKFWILSKDLPKVIETIMKKLPMHLFNEDELIQETTSIYLDNEQLGCYHQRISKIEGADLVRLRWYGDLKNLQKVFVEQKVHHEGWSQEPSSKDRFLLDKDLVYDYLSQEDYEVNQDIASLELVDQVKESIDRQKLRPYLATRYLRFAFQDEDNDYLRISIDTNLRMIKKTGDLNEWSHCENVVRSDAIHFFPYAVMEVKLREPFIDQRPAWIDQLLARDEIIPAPGFSKYQHGCSLLHRDRVEILPDWIKENELFSLREGLESLNRIQRTSNTMIRKENRPLVKVEPRILLANERNFYHWLSLAFMLLRLSLNRKISFLIKMFALGTALWAIINGAYLYWFRNQALNRGVLDGYGDRWGLIGVAFSVMILVLTEILVFISEEFTLDLMGDLWALIS